MDNKAIAMAARDIRHEIEEALTGEGIYVNGVIDHLIDEILKRRIAIVANNARIAERERIIKLAEEMRGSEPAENTWDVAWSNALRVLVMRVKEIIK